MPSLEEEHALFKYYSNSSILWSFKDIDLSYLIMRQILLLICKAFSRKFRNCVILFKITDKEALPRTLLDFSKLNSYISGEFVNVNEIVVNTRRDVWRTQFGKPFHKKNSCSNVECSHGAKSYALIRSALERFHTNYQLSRHRKGLHSTPQLQFSRNPSSLCSSIM